MHSGCDFKETAAKPLKPWNGPLGAFCLSLVPVWPLLLPETRKDIYDAITGFQEGEELMARAGLRV